MTITAESRKHREQLLAMILDLQSNRVILDELLNCYGAFLFTGGTVPRERWNLVAITSYLQHPFAADCISTAEAERYQHLAETIMDLGQAIAAGVRPRTLRCRYDIAAMFNRESSEIQTLGRTLESAVTRLVGELKPPPPLSKTKSGLESVKSDFSSNKVLVRTTGGDQ